VHQKSSRAARARETARVRFIKKQFDGGAQPSSGISRDGAPGSGGRHILPGGREKRREANPVSEEEEVTGYGMIEEPQVEELLVEELPVEELPVTELPSLPEVPVFSAELPVVETVVEELTAVETAAEALAQPSPPVPEQARVIAWKPFPPPLLPRA
jgi:hypothetical protein